VSGLGVFGKQVTLDTPASESLERFRKEIIYPVALARGLVPLFYRNPSNDIYTVVPLDPKDDDLVYVVTAQDATPFLVGCRVTKYADLAGNVVQLLSAHLELPEDIPAARAALADVMDNARRVTEI